MYLSPGRVLQSPLLPDSHSGVGSPPMGELSPHLAEDGQRRKARWRSIIITVHYSLFIHCSTTGCVSGIRAQSAVLDRRRVAFEARHGPVV